MNKSCSIRNKGCYSTIFKFNESMPLSPINRRKNSEIGKLLKHKKRTETKNGIRDKSNSRENADNSKKANASGSMNTHRKSDADKSLSSDAQDKGRYAFI